MRGDVVRAELWIQLVDTTADINQATTNIRGEELVAYQTTLTGLRRYCFKTRIVKAALGNLMFCRLTELDHLCSETGSATSNRADLETLEHDLKTLQGQLTDLQIKIERKEEEVEE